MIKKIFLLLVVATLIFTACVTGPTISESAEMSKYNYATISNVMDYSSDPFLAEIEVKIYDSLANTRIRMIGDRQIERLTDEQKDELLEVKFTATYGNNKEVSVGINFVEYMTGKPIASIYVTDNASPLIQDNKKHALRKVQEQLNRLFPPR